MEGRQVLRHGDRPLVNGCATGMATLPLARRGFLITCVELGPALAATASQNLASFEGVNVIETNFEAWQPAQAAARFDLVFAATAWQWPDPALKYRRAWRHLRPGGHLAVWDATHVVPAGGDPFFAGLKDVYDEIGEGMPPGSTMPRPDQLPNGIARDRGQRAVRGCHCPRLRLGDQLHRGRVHPPAGHVLRPHRDGQLAA